MDDEMAKKAMFSICFTEEGFRARFFVMLHPSYCIDSFLIRTLYFFFGSINLTYMQIIYWTLFRIRFGECWTRYDILGLCFLSYMKEGIVLQHFPCRQDEILLYVKRISLPNKQMFKFIMVMCTRASVCVWMSNSKRLCAAWANSTVT